METVPSSTREFARRLLALEAGNGYAPGKSEAVQVCERLRVSLTRFAGPDGFTALLRRALTLARIEFPALQAVEAAASGQLLGFEDFFADASMTDRTGASVAVVAWLIALLGTFIGESLTRGLVRDAWPELSQEEWQQIEAL